jgi:hypothetical protein
MLPEFLRDRKTWLWFVVLVAAAMMLATLTARKSHAASLGVEVEGSVGLQATNDQVKALSTSDFSQTGGVLGVGAGLVLQSNSMMASVFGRYSYANTVGDFLGGSVKTSNLIDTGVRLGWRATRQTTLYGEGGYGWENLDLSQISPALGTKTPSGWMLGAGVQHEIGKSNWLVGLEYQHFFFGEQSVPGITEGPAKLTPDSNVVRLGLTYRFGETKAPDVFDTSKLAPEERGCDPKLGNCHTPLK